MTGKLRAEPAGFRPEKHDHFVLQQKRQALVLRDARLFGRVRFHHGRSEPDWWRAGGPEISSGGFNRALLNAFLDRHARAPIKAVLLLQSGFLESGIGWRTRFFGARRSRLRFRRAHCLKLNGLVCFEKHILSRANPCGSSVPISPIRPELADPSKVETRRRLSAASISLFKATIGGRTTAWCPRCQKVTAQQERH